MRASRRGCPREGTRDHQPVVIARPVFLNNVVVVVRGHQREVVDGGGVDSKSGEVVNGRTLITGKVETEAAPTGVQRDS